MIVGEDYKFRPDIEGDTIPIELISGPYKGIVLRYLVVSVDEAASGPVMKYEYELVDTKNFKEKKLREDRYFENHIGVVLNAMILDLLDATEKKEERDDSGDSE